MKRSYQFAVDENARIPVAHIAHGDTWDLVEFLSYRRIVVFYTHCEDYLIVRFPRSDAASAQRILDEWAGAICCEFQQV